MTPAEIIAFCAQAVSLTPDDLRGAERYADIVWARHEAMRQLRETGLSYARIGLLLDKNPKTVAYGVRRARERVNG